MPNASTPGAYNLACLYQGVNSQGVSICVVAGPLKTVSGWPKGSLPPLRFFPPVRRGSSIRADPAQGV